MSALRIDQEEKGALLNRLRRAEGQMRGVQRMIEEDRDCEAILQQLTAVRSALHKASLAMARAYATQCLNKVDDNRTPDQMIDALMNVMGKLPDVIVREDGQTLDPSTCQARIVEDE